jgi:hypothetical protein
MGRISALFCSLRRFAAPFRGKKKSNLNFKSNFFDRSSKLDARKTKGGKKKQAAYKKQQGDYLKLKSQSLTI